MRRDIQSREDIEHLVGSFYKEVRKDSLLGPLFDAVIGDDWEAHFPILFSFWEQVLLGTGDYRRNPMEVHKNFHRQFPLQKVHFKRWLDYWAQTVHREFSGPKADEAILRAQSIAGLMQLKILGQDSFITDAD